eukprot:scaffold24652_cov101-Isochrysis_galbana.AAC.2
MHHPRRRASTPSPLHWTDQGWWLDTRREAANPDEWARSGRCADAPVRRRQRQRRPQQCRGWWHDRRRAAAADGPSGRMPQNRAAVPCEHRRGRRAASRRCGGGARHNT